MSLEKNKQHVCSFHCIILSLFSSSTFNQMMMGSIGYIISGLISTVICACACKLCKKRGSRWIRRLMDSDTEDSQSEGQVQEVSSSGGAVIKMQEFSDTDDNPYEVPIPSFSTVMSSVNPNAPVSFVSASTNNETVHLHASAVVLPSSSLEEQQEAVGGNDQTLPKTVEGELDPYLTSLPKVGCLLL